MTDTIQSEKVVSLAYTLTVDGEVVEQWETADPFEYLHGADNIVPGLEAALQGKAVGDKLTVSVPPAEGYGEYDADDYDEFGKDDIGDAELGMAVVLEDEEGYLFEGIITEIIGDQVKVDFNPPFAGKTLEYVVEILGIRAAEEDELTHGHVHGAGWEDDEEMDWEDGDDEVEDDEE